MGRKMRRTCVTSFALLATALCLAAAPARAEDVAAFYRGRQISWILSADAGHYFNGDVNSLMRLVTGDKGMSVDALTKVGYAYANFHLGFEVGQKYATFYLRGGVSYVNGVVRDPGSSKIDPYTDITFNGDPRIKAWTPSARAGLIVYFAK